MNHHEARRAVQRLYQDGFFLEEDLQSIALSVESNSDAVEAAIREAGWRGDVIIGAHSQNGEWPYYCYDPDRFTSSEVKAAVDRRLKARPA